MIFFSFDVGSENYIETEPPPYIENNFKTRAQHVSQQY